MLRDNRDDKGLTARNVLDEPLEACSTNPMTGFDRDGCCNTGQEDIGSHTECAVMTAAFLDFSKSQGNDLSTPVPAFGFPGLMPGDRWCLCAPRWQVAFEQDQAPRVVLRATHESALARLGSRDLPNDGAKAEAEPNRAQSPACSMSAFDAVDGSNGT